MDKGKKKRKKERKKEKSNPALALVAQGSKVFKSSVGYLAVNRLFTARVSNSSQYNNITNMDTTLEAEPVAPPVHLPRITITFCTQLSSSPSLFTRSHSFLIRTAFQVQGLVIEQRDPRDLFCDSDVIPEEVC